MKLRSSLKTRITITLLVMLFSFSLILIFVVRTVSKISIENYIYNDIYSRQNEMYTGLSHVFDEVNLLYSRMVLNEDFIKVLEDETLAINEKKLLYKEMLDKVGTDKTLFYDVTIIYDDDVLRMNNNISLPDKAFIENVMNSTQLIEIGESIKDIDNDSYLTIGKRMVNFPTGDVRGSVIFYINQDNLVTILNSISGDLGYSFLVKDDKYIVSHTDYEFIGATIFDADIFIIDKLPNYEIRTLNGEKAIIIVYKNQDFNNQYNLNWKIVSVISYKDLFHDIIKLNKYYFILGFIMMVLGTFISIKIAKLITLPMQNIIYGLRKFSATGKKVHFQRSIYDELWELEKTYDDMVLKITELIERNKIEMEKQRELELLSLQMQINPHFLYNTLDAIAWIAKIKKQKEIEKLVLALAKFFRISLHKGDKFITVKEEIELVQNFIEIELIRFPDKFTISYNVEENVKNELTLKLIVQPIVENAIKHGLSQLDEMGHLEINAYDIDEYIYFEVIDNGVGFEVPNNLFSNNKDKLSKEGGYGLKNVDERIKLEYGNDCGISLSSKPNGGTKVVIKIKKRCK